MTTRVDIESREMDSGRSDSWIELPSARSTINTAINAEESAWLNEIVSRAEREHKRFIAAADSNRSIGNHLNLVLLMTLAITGGSSVLYNIFNLEDNDPNFGFSIVTSVLTVVASAITVIQRVCQHDLKAINYKFVGDMFENYAREWRLIIAQGIDDRPEKVAAALYSAESKFGDIQMQAMPL